MYVSVLVLQRITHRPNKKQFLHDQIKRARVTCN